MAWMAGCRTAQNLCGGGLTQSLQGARKAAPNASVLGVRVLNAHRHIPLFRPEVAESRRERLHGDVSLAIPVSWQAIGYLIAAGLLVAGAFLALGSYARVETVAGMVVVDKGTTAITPTRAGVIADLAVREGQRVAAGTPLARIRAEEDLASGGTAPQRVISALRDQEGQLSSQGSLLLQAAAAERARLAASAEGLRQEIATLDQQIADQQRLVSLAEGDFSQVQNIAAKGFLSRRDIEARESALLARRQALSQLHQARAAKSANLAETGRAIAQAGASAQAEAAGVLSQRTELTQQLAQVEAAQGYTLTAPIAGMVTALTARLGQPAEPGRPLMTVMPNGGRKRVELYVPTSAAGFLSRGQEVRLSVDAFPYQRFGTVPARIAEIATTVIGRPGPNGAMVPVYLVTADLEEDSVRAFGRRQPLLPGMALTARIVTQKQSLFEWLFEPLFAVGRR